MSLKMPVVIVLIAIIAAVGLLVFAGVSDIDVPQQAVAVEITMPEDKVTTTPDVERPAPATPAGLIQSGAGSAQ